jgi:hypothetical protein
VCSAATLPGVILPRKTLLPGSDRWGETWLCDHAAKTANVSRSSEKQRIGFPIVLKLMCMVSPFLFAMELATRGLNPACDAQCAPGQEGLTMQRSSYFGQILVICGVIVNLDPAESLSPANRDRSGNLEVC